MIQELLYTSAPRGLKPGSRGFSTVLSTQGMSAPLAAALEGLSGYRPLFAATDPRHASNPVVHSHVTFSVGGRRVNVLSRIADYGLDYTQRSNKLAHHVIVDPENQSAAGPAWLLARSELMRSTWDGEPRIVPLRQSAPMGDVAPAVCTHWKKATGDAGWAGVLAEAFLKDPQRMAFLICPVGLDPLPLIAEAVALLPKERRWDVTFSTYFTSAPQNATCAWRCLLDGTPEVHQSRRYVQALRLNLIEPLAPATGGALVELARTGRMPMSSVQRNTSRDAATEALDDLPPPTGAGGYRLQPVRVAEEPPLLDETLGVRRRRGKSSMLAGTITAAVLLAAVGVGALFWQRSAPNTTSGDTAPDLTAKQPAQAEQPPQANPDLVAKADSSSSLESSEPPVPVRADDEANEESRPSSETSASESQSSESAPQKPTTDGTGTVPSTLQSISDTDQAPTKSQPDPKESYTHVALPVWADNERFTAGFLAIMLPNVPVEQVELRLLAPHNYNGLLCPDEMSSLQNLNICHFEEIAGPAPAPIARFHVEGGSDEPNGPRIEVEWTGAPHRRNMLKWCVLAIQIPGNSEQRAVCHLRTAARSELARGLNSPYFLPAVDFTTTNEKDCPLPVFQYDPVRVQIGTTCVAFEDHPGDRVVTSLDRRFVVKSIAAFGVQFKKVEPALLGTADLPEIRSKFDLQNNTLRLHATTIEKYQLAFIRECNLVLEEAQRNHELQEINVGARPKPETWFAPTYGLTAAAGSWSNTFSRFEKQFRDQASKNQSGAQDKLDHLIALNEIVTNCFHDAQLLLNLENNLKGATIDSLRLFYDVANDQGKLFPVEILRIDSPAPVDAATSGNTSQAKK